MPFICENCGEIYSSSVKKLETNFIIECPKEDCSGQIFEIDDLMVPIIKKLWNLGYRTEYCCSGHAYRPLSHTYIGFSKGQQLPFLPEGFILTQNANGVLFIEKKYPQQLTEAEKLISIMENIQLLHNWTEALGSAL